MTENKHGNMGNKNSAKDVKKEAFIKIRCESDFKSFVVGFSQKHQFKSSSHFVLTAIDLLVFLTKKGVDIDDLKRKYDASDS